MIVFTIRKVILGLETIHILSNKYQVLKKALKYLKTKHLSLSEDKKSGFITLSIKHQSPFVAKQWVELVVNEINSFYRQKDKLESEKAA
jgi:hypothetical protein